MDSIPFFFFFFWHPVLMHRVITLMSVIWSPQVGCPMLLQGILISGIFPPFSYFFFTSQGVDIMTMHVPSVIY